MAKEIQIFSNPSFGEIRTSGTSDEPLFCLADVCKVLDLQVTPTKNRLKQGGVNLIKVIDSLGREQNAIFVNEQNLYRVIMRSDKPQAEPFQDWVCGEVLPAIRKTGSYSVQPQLPNFNNPAEAARAWADQYEKNQTLALEVEKKEQEKQSIIEETKPAVVFTECVTSSSTNILIGDLAKLITQNGYKIGEIRLYEWMVENKFLIRRQRYSKSKNKYVNDYMPTQRAAEMGLSFVKEKPIVSGGSPIFIKHTCYVTGKGQVYFLNKFKSLMAA